jgi:hypothetical protein
LARTASKTIIFLASKIVRAARRQVRIDQHALRTGTCGTTVIRDPPSVPVGEEIGFANLDIEEPVPRRIQGHAKEKPIMFNAIKNSFRKGSWRIT